MKWILIREEKVVNQWWVLLTFLCSLQSPQQQCIPKVEKYLFIKYKNFSSLLLLLWPLHKPFVINQQSNIKSWEIVRERHATQWGMSPAPVWSTAFLLSVTKSSQEINFNTNLLETQTRRMTFKLILIETKTGLGGFHCFESFQFYAWLYRFLLNPWNHAESPALTTTLSFRCYYQVTGVRISASSVLDNKCSSKSNIWSLNRKSQGNHLNHLPN